jgi:peptidoglycan hydrolase-like protein with peptidoglycan-binding domain
MKRLVLPLLLGVAALAAPATALASMGPGHRGPAVGALQRRLIELHYMGPGTVTHVYNYRTTQAVMAFEGWTGLQRDGIAGPKVFHALARAHVPRPWGKVNRHMELHLKKQVLLLINARHVVTRAIHVSTGRPSLPTPAGSFAIYSKQRMSWSRKFQVWLPWASYFYSGDAFHEYPDVPGYPASHGCVRVASPFIGKVWRFATLGTRVLIH